MSFAFVVIHWYNLSSAIARMSFAISTCNKDWWETKILQPLQPTGFLCFASLLLRMNFIFVITESLYTPALSLQQKVFGLQMRMFICLEFIADCHST